MADPLFQHWFHGRISRQDAEELLVRAGKRDGLYLLRESTASAGSYALSMCHNNKIIQPKSLFLSLTCVPGFDYVP